MLFFMSGKVAIIILNWNGKDLLNECISAVLKQEYTPFDTYVVDNGSTDGSVEYIRTAFPQMSHLIALDRNTGYATGNNAGIQEALKDPDVQYIVTLNNDTIVQPKWLSALVEAAKSDVTVGMVSSKALFPDGTIQSVGLALERDLMGDKMGGLSLGYNMPGTAFSQQKEIFAPSGVSALFKREVLERVGMFDDDFFAYAEDVDLGFRVRLAGWTCVYAPGSRLTHLHSQTTGVASPFKAFHTKRNRYFVAVKNFPLSMLLSFPLRDIQWNFSQLLSRDTESSSKQLQKNIGFSGICTLMFRMYIDIIRYLPRMIKKRRMIKKIHTQKNSTVRQWFVRFARKAIEAGQ